MSVRAPRWQTLAPIPAAYPVISAASRLARFRDAHLLEAAVAERRDCPWCGARPGELCRTARGDLAFYHHDRIWPDERKD